MSNPRLPFIRSLEADLNGWAFFLCTQKEMRQGRTGEPFMSLMLQDKTGFIKGRVLNDAVRLRDEFDSGEFVKVQARTDFSNGRLQLVVERIRRINPEQDAQQGFREEDYVMCAARPVEEMWDELQELVRLYRKEWAASGHKPGAEQVQVAQFAYVAEKRAEAQSGFERICKRYLETFADAVQSWCGKSSDQYPGYDKMVASILATTPDKIVAGGGAFVGTPDDVIGQIRGCVDAFGAIEPSMQINFGGSTDQEAFRTLELFAQKVMPHFKN